MKNISLEKMSDFFTARVDSYDDHMLNNVDGCRASYAEMARLVPEDTKKLLDLGCGTGLELEGIFARLPDIEVLGIDLTQAMLDRLHEKYADKNVRTVCASYFDYPFERERFDAAISFQTMHHFTHAKKKALYSRICEALRAGGEYIECDYMVLEQAEEDLYFAESRRLKAEQGLSEEDFYHYDTPCTIENQIALLEGAGFRSARRVWREENTTILVAVK